mmetsp:Transcript_24000/g.78086  ORF Transcript_24000/g.78086 Transcript_24000/m.78086 type:complete len:227 (-) Transcript_24000:1255-1935(-)
MFFTHVLPWACGSIKSGQRFPRVTRMPLSMDTESVGRPQMFHSRTSTGDASVPRSVQSADTGICSSVHRSTHPFTSSLRYEPVKAPKYAMHAAERKTSPTSSAVWSWMASAVSFQRTCSSARPVVSFSARARRFSVRSAWSCKFFCSAWAASSCALSAATRSITSLSASCFSLSVAFAAASCDSASRSAARFGSTTFATLEYVSMARLHMHRLIAAFDWRATVSGV